MSTALVAVAVFVAYTALVAVLWRVLGVRYDHLADSRRDAMRGIVVPIGLGAVLLAVVVTALGWWGPAMTEPERHGPAWVLAVPVLLGVAALVGISSIDFRSPGAKVLPVILLGVALVGFAEEMLTRGQLVVGLREAGVPEWGVVVGTCVLFGLLHAINALFGQSLSTTVVQIVFATLVGLVFYVTRMSTGLLVVCMVLHALWDFASLGNTATGTKPRLAAPLLLYATFALSLVAVFFVV